MENSWREGREGFGKGGRGSGISAAAACVPMPADGSAAAVGERLHALQSACRAAHAAAIQSTIRQIEAYLPEAVGTLRSEAPAEAAVNSLIELLLAVLEACGKEQPAQQVHPNPLA